MREAPGEKYTPTYDLESAESCLDVSEVPLALASSIQRKVEQGDLQGAELEAANQTVGEAWN